MDRRTGAVLRFVDRNDSTLALDGLLEFLPRQTDPDDSTLSVHSLHMLFDERPPEPTAVEEPAFVPDPELEAGRAEDYFGEEVPIDDEVGELAELPAKSENAFWVSSETKRAALDFQRFAEKFHAFAVTCQQR